MKRNLLDCIKVNPCCDICGDKGVIEAIITCCDCKISRQHLYCMRVVTTDAPPFWFCEECERKKLFSPSKTEKEHTLKPLTQKDPVLIPKNSRVSKCPPIKTTFANRFNFKEKRVEKGRTKYISCEEAVNLSSGAFSPKNQSLLKSMGPPLPREKSLSKIYGDTMFKPPPVVVQKSTAMKESIKSNKSCTRVERTNIEKEDDIRKHIEVAKLSKKLKKTITKESTKMDSEVIITHIKEEASEKVKDTNMETEDDMRKHIEVPKSSEKIEKTITQENIKMEKSEVIPPTKEEVDKKPLKSSIKIEDSIMETEGNENHADVAAGSFGESNLTMGGPVSKMHDTSIPSLHSYWKGSFYLPNEHENLDGAFKAHPPSRVHSKVYEALQKMPENIYFEVVTIDEVWVDLFKGDCPYKDDIGLYFFPRFKKRYEDCTSLVDFLWSRNLVMKSFVNEVALFVLSSRYLQLDSQKFEGSYFLWGVFRQNKVKKEGLSKSKSMIVHESFGQRGVVDSQGSKCADFPPGFENMFKPLPQG